MSQSGRRRGRRPATETGVSSSVSQILPLAVHQHQEGNLDRAKTLYEQLIERDPRHADALQYYGILCHQMGDTERAEALIRQAITLQPGVAPYYDNLGSVLEAKGCFEAALAAYEKADALEPGDPDRHYNRGIALAQLGRLDDAIGDYQAALRARPRDPECYFSLGNVFKAKGQFQEAQSAYLRCLEIAPHHEGACNNLGTVLQARGQRAEAEDCYRNLLVRHPHNTQAQHNLATVLNQQGRVQDALVHFKKALKADPGFTEACLGMARATESLGDFQVALEQYQQLIPDRALGAEARNGLVRIARFYSPPGYDAQFSAVLLAVIEEGQVPADLLARALGRQWLLKAGLSAPALDYDGQVLQIAVAAGTDPLLLTLLRSSINVEPLLEKWLTRLRRIFLFNHEGLEDLAPLRIALAIQCFHNEYVFCFDEDERVRVDELEGIVREPLDAAAVGSDAAPASLELLQLACYRPLYRLRMAGKLAAAGDANWPADWHQLLAVSLHQPLREAELAGELAVLGSESDSVSVQVRAQYEENPYPRWLALPRPRGDGLAGLLAGVLQRDTTGWVPTSDHCRILAAGCGTGQEALALARLEPRARLLAVDLSRASLAYAQRMAQSIGLDNIQFMRGDLLQLPAVHEQLDGPFDLIVSSGVLHHLRDPQAGWRALNQVLRPGGLMKVALYSTLARHMIARAHERIRSLDLPGDAHGVRGFRRRLLNGREPELESLLDSEDFYTTSTCRDLLFHVMEHTFDIPRIGGMLTELGLEFLGFELAHPRIREEFARNYPHQQGDLQAWEAFEKENPDTFEAMYVIWCRKPVTAH